MKRDWNKLKNDTDNLISNINTALNDVVDSDNEKVKGYKSSLNHLLNKLKTFQGKIINKNGMVKSDDDDYTLFLENRYYLESQQAELSLLCGTVSVLKLTKEL